MKKNTHFSVIKIGFTHCFLIKGKHYLLIDTGPPGSGSRFIKSMHNIDILPSEVKWIFLTHGHWDHAGALDTMKRMTGAKSMIHTSEKEWIENGIVEIPSGLVPAGKIMHCLMKAITPLVSMPVSTIDMPLSNDPFSLIDFEIAGKIIHTPGHTTGSMSLLLDSGEAFVGDLAMNGFPQIQRNGIPVVGDDLNEVKRSWKILLDHNVKIIYPSHGNPFSPDIMERILVKSGSE